MKGVPFTDLRAMHEEVRTEIETAWRDLIDRSAFVGGPAVAEFEKAFAGYCDVPHAIGVGTGTDALRVALQAVGVGAADLVVTVPHTFIATIEAIFQVGADPIFIDVDPVSYTIDIEQTTRYLERECTVRNGVLVERRRERRIACLLPVHLYGHPADMDPLVALAKRFDLAVVEDACQAHGARYRGRRCGSLGDAAAFSFYPGKNLGAMGEAGAVTTVDPAVADQCRILRDHGQSERYLHVRGDGSNARLDALQAIVLSAKLKRLEAWNDRRRQVARWYGDHLADLEIVVPLELPQNEHVYHLYVVQIDQRDLVRRALDRRAIGTGLHYPVPLHLQRACEGMGLGRGAYPASERIANRGLSLPMFPHMTEGQVHEVATALREAVFEAAGTAA